LYVIGVTGGIGAGKSMVSRILVDLGAKVVDADKIARDIVKPGEPALMELVNEFGKEILTGQGELDRQKLSQMVFGDNEKIEKLNKITHKYIVERIINLVEKEKRDKRFDIIVLDVPIPVKKGFLDIADEIWVVTADKETRIERIIKRSGFTREEAEKRIASLPGDEEYLEIADEVIENNSSLEELEKKVAKLYVKVASR